MLQFISWKQYFTCLLIFTILFYLFVWIFFYQAKLSVLPWLRNRRTISLPGEDQPDELLSTTQQILDEIKPVFTKQYTKNELLLALQVKLKRYSEWDEPGFRDTINEFISAQSQSKCSIRLSEEDKRAIWL